MDDPLVSVFVFVFSRSFFFLFLRIIVLHPLDEGGEKDPFPNSLYGYPVINHRMPTRARHFLLLGHCNPYRQRPMPNSSRLWHLSSSVTFLLTLLSILIDPLVSSHNFSLEVLLLEESELFSLYFLACHNRGSDHQVVTSLAI